MYNIINIIEYTNRYSILFNYINGSGNGNLDGYTNKYGNGCGNGYKNKFGNLYGNGYRHNDNGNGYGYGYELLRYYKLISYDIT